MVSMNPNLLRSLLPYLKYLPVIVSVVTAIVHAVEASASEDNQSKEKQAAARGAIKAGLAQFGIVLDDAVINLLIDGVVSVNNLLGKFTKKSA